jgi:branched-chain amino acid transport system permease protein
MGAERNNARRWFSADVLMLTVALLIPLIERVLPEAARIGDAMPEVFIFAILGLGLNIVTGFTGLLNLGVAAFMAIGAYSFAILTCDIYPFRLGFWGGLVLTPIVGAIAGLLLGAPTMRLRGDYLAIVTLGFGEIVQDVLRNLDSITKGTQGINPLPSPVLPGIEFRADAYQPWYYLFLGLLVMVVIFNRNLENSRIGRAWISIREDELAASCMGINPTKTKLLAFAIGAALAALAGALFASRLNTTAEPSSYDFTVSILALCIVIVGGMGSISGVMLGALVMIGINSIVLAKVTSALQSGGSGEVSATVLANPTNWKFMIFGLALVLMMRFRPEGLLASRRTKAEMHRDEDGPGSEHPRNSGRREAASGGGAA